MLERDFGAVPRQTSTEYPKPTMPITVRTDNIFAGLHSKVKKVHPHEGKIEISTPYDVSGDPFFIPIGEKITVEWDLESEARQQDFFVESYHEVANFLKDETWRPTVVLNAAPTKIEKLKIERAYYRTSLQVPILILVDDKDSRKVDMVDISGGGIAFLYSRPIPSQKLITVHLPYVKGKDVVQVVEVSGRVVNLSMIHPKEYRMGMQFDRIMDRDRDAIIRFVNYCTGKKRAGSCKTCELKRQQMCNF